jgi:hypothetical protein
LGEDIGQTAVQSVMGAVNGVKQVGGDTVKATFTAVKTVLTVASEISEEAVVSVKNALKESIDGADDIM